jgi:hypothetical protein
MYMNISAVKSCGAAGSCPPAQHPAYAWAFAILFVLGVAVYGTAVMLRARKAKYEGVTDPDTQAHQKGKTRHEASIYAALQPRAKNVKAVLQMVVGVVTVAVIGWRYFDTLGGNDPASLFLNGVGIGLAVAAALELAYTLFTDGPDEALDPLISVSCFVSSFWPVPSPSSVPA